MRSRLATGDEWWRPMPPGASADALRVLAARCVRVFGDGFVALLLPIYLVERGFSAFGDWRHRGRHIDRDGADDPLGRMDRQPAFPALASARRRGADGSDGRRLCGRHRLLAASPHRLCLRIPTMSAGH
ncbi:MAG: hypothetical protein WA417_21525 [Stellaceae bacterium]